MATTPNRAYPVPEGTDPFEPRKWIDDLGKAVDADVESLTLAELDDVAAATPTAGDVLVYDGSVWRKRATTQVLTYADLAAGFRGVNNS